MHVNMSHLKEPRPQPAGTRTTKGPQKPKPSHKSAPIDAKDLTRRLQVVLAEQKAYSEKKRRQRAEADSRKAEGRKDERKVPSKEAVNGNRHEGRRPRMTGGQVKDPKPLEEAYRHAPQTAATQFERTTSVRSPSEKILAHKLSGRAIRFNKDGPNASVEIATIDENTAPIEQMRAMKIARAKREEQYERNQFQHPAIPEVVDEANPNRHTFDSSFKREADDGLKRRKSTSVRPGRASTEMDNGGALGRISTSDDSHRAGFNKSDFRVDWTQSDEGVGSPGLRKRESIWTLRGRLGSLTKHKDDRETMPSVEEAEHPLKSPKSGIFGRFKR